MISALIVAEELVRLGIDLPGVKTFIEECSEWNYCKNEYNQEKISMIYQLIQIADAPVPDIPVPPAMAAIQHSGLRHSGSFGGSPFAVGPGSSPSPPQASFGSSSPQPSLVQSGSGIFPVPQQPSREGSNTNGYNANNSFGQSTPYKIFTFDPKTQKPQFRSSFSAE